MREYGRSVFGTACEPSAPTELTFIANHQAPSPELVLPSIPRQLQEPTLHRIADDPRNTRSDDDCSHSESATASRDAGVKGGMVAVTT